MQYVFEIERWTNPNVDNLTYSYTYSSGEKDKDWCHHHYLSLTLSPFLWKYLWNHWGLAKILSKEMNFSKWIISTNIMTAFPLSYRKAEKICIVLLQFLMKSAKKSRNHWDYFREDNELAEIIVVISWWINFFSFEFVEIVARDHCQ